MKKNLKVLFLLLVVISTMFSLPVFADNQSPNTVSLLATIPGYAEVACNCRDTPSTSGRIIYQYEQDEVITVLDPYVGDWTKVRTPLGSIGYVRSDLIYYGGLSAAGK